MSKIGHARIGDDGRARGGKAGDQRGDEVCFGSWYSKGWNFVLRAKDKDIAERMALACEAGCRNDKIGYDMNQRNTLRTQAKLCGWIYLVLQQIVNVIVVHLCLYVPNVQEFLFLILMVTHLPHRV